MKTKITQFVPLTITLVAIGFCYFSFWCTNTGNLCYRTWLDSISLDVVNPLYFFSLFFLPIAIVLIFVPRHIFISWLKLAAWAIPLSILYIATTPVNSNAWINFFPFYRDDAARLAGEVFAAASLLLILWKYLVARRQ